ARIGMAQPERLAIVGEDEVEGAVGRGLEAGERLGRFARIGMVERFEHELAARALAWRGAERAVPVENPGDQPEIIDAEPGAAGQFVAPGHDFRPVGPVSAGWLPGAVD